jgi:hypothetical protein
MGNCTTERAEGHKKLRSRKIMKRKRKIARNDKTRVKTEKS